MGYLRPMSVAVERNGPVTTVILDRPEVRNAVDGPTAQALADAFRAFDADDDARVGVLWGSGGAFCAGANLKRAGTAEGNRVAPDGDGPMGPSRMLLGKPVIAAVAGHAVAGGLELALWCDLRVVEEDAVLGVFCRRWGVPLIDGGTVRLPRIVGLGRALDLILTGRPVGAEEALAIGLANRVVPSGTSREAAEALAARAGAVPAAVHAPRPPVRLRAARPGARRGNRQRAAPRARRARARDARRRRPLRGGRGPSRRLRRSSAALTARPDGRFAPSPSGPLHLGNLRTALLAWLFARSAEARFLVRVEDLDPGRSRREHEAGQLADLAALGLDRDGPVVRQSERRELHRAALEALRAAGRVYPCWCTRAEIREAASAAHGPLAEGAYPGTCRELSAAQRTERERGGRPAALRLDAGGERVAFVDRLHGEVEGVVDDLVLWRNDDTPAYNLAVVVDDADQGIAEVVRGDDLLDSTPRQLAAAAPARSARARVRARAARARPRRRTAREAPRRRHARRPRGARRDPRRRARVDGREPRPRRAGRAGRRGAAAGALRPAGAAARADDVGPYGLAVNAISPLLPPLHVTLARSPASVPLQL